MAVREQNLHLSRCPNFRDRLSSLSGQCSLRLLITVISNGSRGVYLFFAFSGMILALPFARYYLAEGNKVSLKKYYMRRVTRLEPPWVLSLLLFTVVFAIGMHGLPAGYLWHALARAC